jgi:hypothetical protein
MATETKIAGFAPLKFIAITTKKRKIAGFAPLKFIAITTKEREVAGFAPLNIFAIMAEQKRFAKNAMAGGALEDMKSVRLKESRSTSLNWRIRAERLRLEKAVQLGLIDESSAFCATGIAPVIANILHKKIGPDHQTLHDLCLTHANYFGFTTQSGDLMLKEQSAFVTDVKRNPAIRRSTGARFTEEEFWKFAKTEVLFESFIQAFPARRVETELQTVFDAEINRLWHVFGAGSYYSSEKWLRILNEEKRFCSVFVTYMPLAQLHEMEVKFHPNLPLHGCSR